MPYKTRYGKHYHMEEGCHGATIPCDTGGLSPCSDCCGTKGGGGTVPQGGDAGGTTGGNSDGAAAYAVPAKPAKPSEPAAEPSDSEQSIGEYLESLAQRPQTSESIAPDPDSLLTPDSDSQGMPTFTPPNQSPDAADQDILHERFSIADNGEVVREPPSAEGIAPDPDGMPIFMPPNQSPDISDQDAPHERFSIADNGEAVREPPSTGDSAPDPDGMPIFTSPSASDTTEAKARKDSTETVTQRARTAVDRLDNSMTVRLGAGHEAEAREQISAVIGSRADAISDTREREAFRKAAQERWNELHPEAKVLVWSKEDEGYVADTERSVLQRQRNYSEMRSFAAGGTAHVGYDYSIKSKATGEDITEQVANANAELRIARAAINRLEEKARDRGRAEVVQQERGLFRDWLEEKQRTNKDWRYHRGVYNPDTRASLRHEFRKETGYEPPQPRMLPTDEERELMYGLNARLAKATNNMDDLVLDHDLSEEMISAVAPKDLWVPGELTDDRGRRFSA